MVKINEIDRQLKAIGVTIRYWGRAEVKEMQHVLLPGEVIKGCINGRYEGGFAMLTVTDQRILLIDKKPLYLTVEDIRYDMVAEVDCFHRVLDSTMSILTPNKTLVFTSFKQKPLKLMATYVQHRVMEFRQQHMMQDISSPNAVPQGQVMDPVALQYQYPAASNAPATPITEAFAAPDGVNPIQFRFTNPYTKMPLIMRRRVSRFYNS